jgi:hypothetical protein
MQTAIDLEIASVAFRFLCPPGRVLAPIQHPFFRSFLLTSGCGDSISIRLDPAIPDKGAFRKWRVSPDALTWFRDGDDYLVELRVPKPGMKPEWLARFRPRFDRDVVVHCGEDLLTEVDGHAALHTPYGTPLLQILLTYYFASRQGALHHATGAVIDGKTFLFPGRSGAGKSTLARLLAESGTAEVLSDDRVFLRQIDDHIEAFGTPWASEARAALNEHAPLAAICFLHQAGENRLLPITPHAALEKLLHVTAIPWHDPDVMPLLLDYCGDLVARTPCFELHFRPDASVCDLLGSTTVAP